MPIDLTTLNGVTFGDDTLSSAANGGVIQAGGGRYYVFVGTEDNFSSGGTISNAESSSYRAAFTANGTYYLPTFGSFTITGVDGGAKTLWVHGFSEDGQSMLLTEHEVQGWLPAAFNGVEGGPIVDFPSPGLGSTGKFMILSNGALTPGTTISGNYLFFSTIDPGYAPPPQPCFAEGSRIATVNGLVRVEDLAVGNEVLTLSGEARAIKWIGHATVHPARHPRPWEVNPVRVNAGAFGAGLPVQDLRLSPGHAVFVDGVLVPVGALVNGATIVQEAVDTIRYLHIELESHDVLLAEGLPCESYLDDGNRNVFANAGEVAELHGRLDPLNWDDACAPMVAAGPQLLAIQQKLLAEAEALGWTRSDEPALTLLADGVEIAPTLVEGQTYRFEVPAAADLALCSSAGVLAQTMPGLADYRLLGVAVGALRIDGTDAVLDGDQFAAGFYPAEQSDGHSWRWTNGNARLDLGLTGPAVIEVSLAMVAPNWQRAVPALRIAEAA